MTKRERTEERQSAEGAGADDGEALNLAALRERLAGASGRTYWRSLEELAETPGFRRLVEREFPEQAATWTDAVSRRRFLQLMGASLALMALSGCTRQPERGRILPYVREPEGVVQGVPLHFATALPLGGYARGAVVTSQMGRPIKVEGNPRHPASLGGTDAFMQAATLGLADPDRSQAVLQLGRIRTWAAAIAALRGRIEGLAPAGGAGLRVLTGTVTSPTLARQLEALGERLPEARWHAWEPVTRDAIRAGARLAFDAPLEPVYRFDRARVVVALDADPLFWGPGALRQARDHAGTRRVREPGDAMSRLYVAEPTLSVTGSVADHRLPLQAREVAALAAAIAEALGLELTPAQPPLPAPLRSFARAVASDLQAARGEGLVLAGEGQPPAVHALAHAINAHLGNAGRTVDYIDPVDRGPADQLASLAELVEAMRAGEVDTLLILGGNPAYDAPADLGFADALGRVALRAHMSLYVDETSLRCHWHLPEAHPLESWGDARAFDGTASIQQPLIDPLYAGRSHIELMADLLETEERRGLDVVRATWRARWGDPVDLEQRFRRAVHDGVVEGTASQPQEAQPREDLADALAAAWPSPPPAAGDDGDAEPAGDLELVIRPDPAVWDGRFANLGWLQELPRPMTKVTWGNAAHVSPRTAERLGLRHGQVVELEVGGRSVRAPVWVLPGQADGAVAVHLGYGRTRAGRAGTGVGFDGYALRRADGLWARGGLRLRPTDARHRFATTQTHWTMEGRQLVRAGTREEFAERPDFVRDLWEEPPQASLHPPWPYPDHKWGMAVDLNTCIGCNACVTACQAENNTPVVGAEQVRMGREMHWLRIDRYFEGSPEQPQVVQQPVMCMHCENAPCEPVCPVAATVHSSEGLNEMVYNRCVGTRYCSNNCPYKVRRFNYLQYTDWTTPTYKAVRNPEVTVRERGVMEKCTYCVQRISRARIEARKAGRHVRDGEIETACQQACPTQAIRFGDLNDPDSVVARDKQSPLQYGILTELNTHPRTSYLARVRNPNPDLEGA